MQRSFKVMSIRTCSDFSIQHISHHKKCVINFIICAMQAIAQLAKLEAILAGSTPLIVVQPPKEGQSKALFSMPEDPHGTPLDQLSTPAAEMPSLGSRERINAEGCRNLVHVRYGRLSDSFLCCITALH